MKFAICLIFKAHYGQWNILNIVAFLYGIGIAFVLALGFCQDFYWPMYSLFYGDF